MLQIIGAFAMWRGQGNPGLASKHMFSPSPLGCDGFRVYGNFWERVIMAVEFKPLSFISQGQKCC